MAADRGLSFSYRQYVCNSLVSTADLNASPFDSARNTLTGRVIVKFVVHPRNPPCLALTCELVVTEFLGAHAF